MGMIWEGRAVTAEEADQLVADPELLWELDEGEPPAVIDLDKAWHGIHWLLCGSADGGTGPLADAVLGGEEFGEDQGFGPPRLLAPDRVAAVHAALSAVTVEELRSRFDPAAMAAADVYPDIWAEPGLFDEYVVPNLVGLRALYAYAAERGLAVVQALG